MSAAFETKNPIAAQKWRPYPEYKNSGIEWLCDIPLDWQVHKLGSKCSVKARLGWKGLKAAVYVDNGYIFLATPNIKERDIDFENVDHITPARYFESPEIMLRVGDVLVAKDGATLGITNLIRKLPAPATVNGSIAVLRPKPGLDSSFLYYWLSSDYSQQVIQRMKGGMGVPHLFQADLRKFVVACPALTEQIAIAAFLDLETAKIDALIAKRQQLIVLLEEKRAALISRAVTKGLDPSVPMKDSDISWLGKIPAHWGAYRVKHVAKLRSGHTPSRQHPEYWVGCSIPWFSLADVWQIREESREYLGETNERISELGLANSAAELLPSGTVVLSRTASVGFSGIMPCPMATTQDFANWVCGPNIRPEYLLYVFRGMGQEFKRLTMGSTHQTIYMPDIGKLCTAVPPPEEQDKIVEFIRAQTARLSVLKMSIGDQIGKLKEYRTALISAAVTGKIDVRGEVQ